MSSWLKSSQTRGLGCFLPKIEPDHQAVFSLGGELKTKGVQKTPFTLPWFTPASLHSLCKWSVFLRLLSCLVQTGPAAGHIRQLSKKIQRGRLPKQPRTEWSKTNLGWKWSSDEDPDGDRGCMKHSSLSSSGHHLWHFIQRKHRRLIMEMRHGQLKYLQSEPNENPSESTPSPREKALRIQKPLRRKWLPCSSLWHQGDLGKGYLIPKYINRLFTHREGKRKEFMSLSYIKGNRCDFLYKRAFH